MTDKEIIIDGVNVSECSYYSSETYPYTCEVWDNECEAQNCYYKQLKRLEQENTELKAENEILKEFLNQYQEEANALKSYETYKVWLNNKYRKENERLKQTLQEIKGIAERTGCRAILDLITKAESEG